MSVSRFPSYGRSVMPIAYRDIHLRKEGTDWVCLQIGIRYTHFFLAAELSRGKTPREAYERAFPPTLVGKIAKWWRELCQ